MDYASEPEEEAEAQQARRLAEMETELGVLPGCARDGYSCAGCAVGSPRVGRVGTGGRGGERGEVWHRWRGGERSDFFCASLVGREKPQSSA